MAARHIGLLVGAAALLASIFLPTPAGMQREAFIVAGLVVLMAAWWMTEALPLTATALMPFVVLPFAGVMSAKETASADRKSTRLNSSHVVNSYAVFCLKKKTLQNTRINHLQHSYSSSFFHFTRHTH